MKVLIKNGQKFTITDKLFDKLLKENIILETPKESKEQIISKLFNYVVSNNTDSSISFGNDSNGTKNINDLKAYINKINNIESLSTDNLIKQKGNEIISNLKNVLKPSSQYDALIDTEYNKIQTNIKLPLGKLCQNISNRINKDNNGILKKPIDVTQNIDDELTNSKDQIVSQVKKYVKQFVDSNEIKNNKKVGKEVVSLLRKSIYNHLKTKLLNKQMIDDSAKKTPEISSKLIKGVFIQIVEGLYGIIYDKNTKISDIFDLSGANTNDSIIEKWNELKNIIKNRVSKSNSDMDDIFIKFFEKSIEIIDNDTSKQKLNYQKMLLNNYNKYNNVFSLTKMTNSLSRVDKEFVNNKLLDKNTNEYKTLLKKVNSEDEIKNISQTILKYIFKSDIYESHNILYETSKKLDRNDKKVIFNAIDVLQKYKEICHEKMRQKYNEVDNMSNINSIKKTISELNDQDFINIYSSYTRVEPIINMMKYYVINNMGYLDKLGKGKMLNMENKSSVIKEFVKLMGREPSVKDIKMYDDFLDSLKEKIFEMNKIIKDVKQYTRNNYIYNHIHYVLSQRVSSMPFEFKEYAKLDDSHDENKFINQMYAYILLSKIKDNNDLSPTFKRLLDKIFENKHIIKEKDVKPLIYDFSIISHRVSIYQIRTVISKIPLFKTKYKIDFENTANEIFNEQPMIITSKKDDQFAGLIILKNYNELFKKISNTIKNITGKKFNSGNRLV